MSTSMPMRAPLRDHDNQLGGITDLCLVADIKVGLVDALVVINFADRLQRVLRTLHALRLASRESLAQASAFTDVVVRWRIVHSFRWAILPPAGPGLPSRLLLNVVFDGGWEPYLRVIWDQLGSTLDLILCHVEGYPLSSECSFDTYAAWVRAHEVTADFLFIESGRTVSDAEYLRALEAQQRGQPDPLAAQRPRVPSAGDTRPLPADPTQRMRMTVQALNGLAALYGLQRYFGAGASDGNCVRRAARDVFFELVELLQDSQVDLPPPVTQAYHDMLAWFQTPVLQPPVTPRPLTWSPEQIQAGVLTPLDADRGALVLLRVVQPAAALAWVSSFEAQTEGSALGAGDCWRQISLSLSGLRALGLPEARLARFPQAFREGMAQRAGLLGDVRHNHPRQWKLPQRRHGGGTVDPGTMHIAVLLRYHHTASGPHDQALLDREITRLQQGTGCQVLAVERMRTRGDDHEGFGFADGISQPRLGPEDSPRHVWSDEVPIGEIFQGFPTLRDKGHAVPEHPDALLDRGSFLVVRKLRQHVARFHQRVLSEAHRLRLDPELLYAKLMGRQRDGVPLAEPAQGTTGNDFNYRNDANGAACPFHAHIRRANPREQQDIGGLRSRMPRIVRRGMSYGPVPSSDGTEPDQGLMFIAYNAHLAEQFEVIQRWMAGANASGGYAGQPDPLLAVVDSAEPDTSRLFPFEHGGQAYVMNLGNHPLVELQWGAYFFLPSIPALRALPGLVELPLPASPAVPTQMPPTDNLAAWQMLLEDPNARDGAWAWVRAQPGGVVRTAYGVLVGESSQVLSVLRDPHQRYSVQAYARKMSDSIGVGYLGLDDPEHDRQARAVNAALEAVSEAEAFAAAHEVTTQVLAGIHEAANAAVQLGLPREAPLDLERLSETVLAALCKLWFGLPDGQVMVGVEPPRAGQPRCPHALFNVSRYVFGVHPSERACQAGRDDGQAFRDAVGRWLQTTPIATMPALAQRILAGVPGQDADLKARTFAGILLGFPPTTHANLLWCLGAWVSKGKLWDLQQAWLDVPGGQPRYAAAVRELRPTLMATINLRPVPFQVMRLAKAPHRLGQVDLQADDLLVVGLGSATQQNPGLHHVSFGGDRADPEGPPPHACPGYAMGMGVMLGIIAALLETSTLKPTGNPLGLYLQP